MKRPVKVIFTRIGYMSSTYIYVFKEWDEELEIEAQTWADQCITDHDCPQCRDLERFQVTTVMMLFY